MLFIMLASSQKKGERFGSPVVYCSPEDIETGKITNISIFGILT